MNKPLDPKQRRTLLDRLNWEEGFAAGRKAALEEVADMTPRKAVQMFRKIDGDGRLTVALAKYTGK